MKTRPGFVLILCLLALPGFADGGARGVRRPAGPVVAQTSVAVTPTRRRLPLEPCPQPGAPKGSLCGRFEVFEDAEARAGRKIGLNVIVLPALSTTPAPDPVFYLAGGPGAAATTYAEAPFMEGLRRTRDVVLVDQRGTGESNPLRCQFLGDPDDMRGYFGEPFPAPVLRECRERLGKVADLRLYTTPDAMADLDEVRDRLGYERVNVYGGSYGSTAALAYLHFYPRRVRAVALLGVAPLDYKLPLPFARGVEHALERLFADCAADDKCRAAFPRLRKEFDEVVARLEKAPATFEATNPYTGQRQQITLTRTGMMEHVRMMLYLPEVTSSLPALVHEMHGQAYARFATVGYQVLRQIDSGIARGMQLSVMCAEHLPFITEEDVRRETAGTFYGDSRLRSTLKACEQWPRGKLAARYTEPVKSDTSVLMMSGELDPVTPPWAAAALLRGLPNARQVVARNATHNSYECLERLAAEFINRGTAQGLDTSCAERIQRPPFVTALPPLPQR